MRGIATCAPAVPRKSERFGSVLIGFENKKMAGTEENIGRFLEILRSSKITLDNFLSVPPLMNAVIYGGGPSSGIFEFPTKKINFYNTY